MLTTNDGDHNMLNTIRTHALAALVVAAPVSVHAESTEYVTDSYLASEYQQLFHMYLFANERFEAILDINYSLSLQCGFILPVKNINDTNIVESVMALRVVQGKGERYFKFLEELNCEDIRYGLDV
jgi:hypothetical protein